ncbi:hypothetical protein TWF730_009695 [Orbilia blumenaviensis]|uniref:F-box domain-containing protein n=1 Tax=Orbilia blumenaviensis TaxID=1796055 RepID=A0AAV9UV16_9PEZI
MDVNTTGFKHCKLTLQSLPHDIIWCILANIDNKPDLTNLCTVLPNTAGSLTKKWTSLYDRLCWQEIDGFYFPYLAVLDLAFNGNDEAAMTLGYSVAHPAFPNNASLRIYSFHKWDKEFCRSARVSLPGETVSRIKDIHLQIERMAEIFMEHRLESHHSPPEAYIQPTLEERGRIVKAVYIAWIIGLQISIESPNPDPSLRSRGFGGGAMILFKSLCGRLTRQWPFWEVRGAKVAFSILWSEIPRELSERLFGELGELNTRGCDNVTRFLDFIFSSHEWNADKYLKLFDRRGNEELHPETADTEILKYMRSFGAASMGIMFDFPAGLASRLILERMDIAQRLKREYFFHVEQRIQLYESLASRPNDPHLSDIPPEAKRLIGDVPPPSNTLPRYWCRPVCAYIGNGRTLWNWTKMATVNIEDCLWDDWRLEGWGYRFPQTCS